MIIVKVMISNERCKRKQDVEFNNPAKSPFMIFLDEFIHPRNCPDSCHGTIRKLYTAMDFHDKLEYISKSIETMHLEEAAFKIFSEEHADQPSPKKNPYHYPSKAEIQFYYHQYLALPNIPMKALPQFALKELGVPFIDLIEASRYFKNCDPDVKKEMKTSLTKLISDWKAYQDARDLALLDKWPFLICKNIPCSKSNKGVSKKRAVSVRSKKSIVESESDEDF